VCTIGRHTGHGWFRREKEAGSEVRSGLGSSLPRTTHKPPALPKGDTQTPSSGPAACYSRTTAKPPPLRPPTPTVALGNEFCQSQNLGETHLPASPASPPMMPSPRLHVIGHPAPGTWPELAQNHRLSWKSGRQETPREPPEGGGRVPAPENLPESLFNLFFYCLGVFLFVGTFYGMH
jgi:hypothetical protein